MTKHTQGNNFKQALDQLKFGNIENCYKELESIDPDFKELTAYNEETLEMLEFEQSECIKLEEEIKELKSDKEELIRVIETAIQMLESGDDIKKIIKHLEGE